VVKISMTDAQGFLVNLSVKKNKNRSTFAEVMNKNQIYNFFSVNGVLAAFGSFSVTDMHSHIRGLMTV